MKRAPLVVSVLLLITLLPTACDQARNPLESETSGVASLEPVFAVNKIDVCHLNGAGVYVLISISDNAYPAHIEHGDQAAGSGSLDAFCEPSGVEGGAFSYQSISNAIVEDDLTRVMWHPNGDFALLLGRNGAVVRYETSTRQLGLVQTIGDEVTDLAVASSGDYFVIVGTASGVGHVWRVDVGAGGGLSPAVDEASLPLGSPVGVSVEPGGTRFAIAAATSTLGTNALYLYERSSGLSAPQGYVSSAGVSDLMWGSSFTGPIVVTSEGTSGADSRTWDLSIPLIGTNGWPGSFGNPGGAAWRPGGDFGILTGPTSNKLYVFDGLWTRGTLPLPTGANPNAIGWKADGTRALVVGRAIGSPLYASVVEYRPGSASSYSDSDLYDSSIPQFDSPPWNGNSNTRLLDIAWRPGMCDEGLIVGTDDGTTVQPTFGTVIRFFDSQDASCSP